MTKVKGASFVHFFGDNTPKLSVQALGFLSSDKDNELPVIGTVCKLKLKMNSKTYYEAFVLDVEAEVEFEEAKAELESLIGDRAIHDRYMEEGWRFAPKIHHVPQDNEQSDME